MTVQVDLRDPDFQANPYPTYTQLRADEPVCRVKTPQGQEMWFITRYGDVQAVLKDPRFISDRRRIGEIYPTIKPKTEALEMFFYTLLGYDPPDHTRLRKLVQQAFTPRIIEAMRPRVQAIADELLDRIADQGQADLIDAFAYPLPMTVISELLGIPEEDRDQFRTWSTTIASNAFSANRQEELEQVANDFSAYLRRMFALRRVAPTSDLISALVQAEQAGDRLDERELTAMVFLLIFAGHETTVNLIGSGMLALFEHPDQLARLKAEPELLESAVEELLRYTSPAQGTTLRMASEDVLLRGQLIQAGDLIMAMVASANRDEQSFSGAERLDVGRPNNRHVAFGFGIHYCLGAPLARLEGAIAFETLLRRMPELQLAIPLDDVEWRPGFLLHGLKQLPVTLLTRQVARRCPNPGASAHTSNGECRAG